jgi:hypothetical protein
MLVKLRGGQGFARLGKSSPRKVAVAFCSAASDFASESVSKLQRRRGSVLYRKNFRQPLNCG